MALEEVAGNDELVLQGGLLHHEAHLALLAATVPARLKYKVCGTVGFMLKLTYKKEGLRMEDIKARKEERIQTQII